jgi:ribonuclease HI
VDVVVGRNEDHGSVSDIWRDENGSFREASARTINGLSDPSILEAMACVEALSLMRDLGISRMIISSDCLEVINMMKVKNICKYSVLLAEIERRRHDFEEVIFIH